jgi:DNA-binding GntR family transcriptional regulator
VPLTRGEAIFSALDTGDPDAAGRVMAEHIEHVGRLLDHLVGNGVVDRSETRVP